SYIKEILRYMPSKITVVDTNENALTELTRDLRSSDLLDYRPEYITYPVNLLSDTFDKIFHLNQWDIIANFSAHKHVRSEKDGISVEALIKNNVFGIIKILELCEKNPPNHFFSVSTDKAANPVNIMGASKSLMEKLILSKKNKFRVSTARFANVAFSNGSLLEGFTYRLNKSQPLSCPSDIKRFFVTHEQSGQICLLATFLGESGDVFFPKLDARCDQIYFKDIAIDFLKEKGFEPEYMSSEKDAKDYDIGKSPGMYPIYLFKTDTSGEKEFEEFFTDGENTDLKQYDSLGYIVTGDIELSFDGVIDDFNGVFDTSKNDKALIVKVLQQYLPDFRHTETGKSLDDKM
ncbi:polysaccharide biosynthesis protein, partial [Alphaproteobacteria bacterium]|nr:polysaccharide biosynthesis protein [Alphaproteobacteria bacterium]